MSGILAVIAAAPFVSSSEPVRSLTPATTAEAPPASAPADVSPHTSKARKVIKRSKASNSRTGFPNYNNDDISAMLDVMEEVEPLGSNHWAMVAHKFKTWVIANERPEREQDSLNNKFDKLANAKKKTGDPSCPPNVRRARNIGRDILSKCAAMKLRDSSSSDDDNADTIAALSDNGEGKRSGGGDGDGARGGSFSGGPEMVMRTVGERNNKRNSGATGTPRKGKEKAEDVLVGHIGDMATMIGSMVEMMTDGKALKNKGISGEDVTAIVKAEVTARLRPTNTMLSQMHQIISQMGGSGSGGGANSGNGRGA